MIEKLRPLKSSLTQNGLPKSIVETSRQAFAAAEHIIHNHLLGKKTNNLRGGDLLKKIASRIKEEEDASVQSSRKLRVELSSVTACRSPSRSVQLPYWAYVTAFLDTF